MDSDRELLEAAARAAGEGHRVFMASYPDGPPGEFGMWDANTGNWNPLTRDSEALRLAVKLRVDIYLGRRGSVLALTNRGAVYEERESSDPFAATRRAIVRAAAELGRRG